jgi:hypothetical protein
MNQTHLDYLISIGDKDNEYIGNNSISWAKFVLSEHHLIDNYLDKRFTRYDLLAYCKNPNNNNLNVLLAILSWGGMNRNHGISLLQDLEVIEVLVDNLRKGVYPTRKDAFRAFQQSRQQGQLKGLGIGYFTKLICFLSPDLNGYIMDQWVSKSVNLLTGENIIKLMNGWVNDTNTAETYELFCTKVDYLAAQLGCDGLEAERQIFSVGRGKGKWRTYLIKHYRK